MKLFKKNYMYPLTNQHGVIFPWIMGIAFLLITVTIFTIQIYLNHIRFTHSFEHSIYTQNLLEIAQQNLWNDWNSKKTTYDEPYVFDHPQGHAECTCTIDQSLIQCQWELILPSGSATNLVTSHTLAEIEMINFE